MTDNVLDDTRTSQLRVSQKARASLMQDHLVPPHGGELVNLIASPGRISGLKAESREWASWDLAPGQLCDLELLMTEKTSVMAVSVRGISAALLSRPVEINASVPSQPGEMAKFRGNVIGRGRHNGDFLHCES